MGGCVGTLGDADRMAMMESNRLDKELQQEEMKDNQVIKLLLLGTGESGKSTVFKQMQILYEHGFSEFEKTTYKHVVRRNVVESMQTLLMGAATFGYQLENESSKAAAEFILELDPLDQDFWRPEIAGHINTLWLKNSGEPAVHRAYRQRSKMQLPDSAEYLFSHVLRIGAHGFSPSLDDILRARLRTSGIVERMMSIHGVSFKFLDVGGQRNERRKWVHCFEGVTAIIFVAAISEFDEVLYEDEDVNRVRESVSVFKEVTENRYFSKTDFIIFLNKIDIFKDKIARVQLSDTFPEFKGDNTFDEASCFLRDMFLDVVPEQVDVFPHFTCATDTANVERVFDSCRRIILKNNLKKLGLA